MTRTTYVTDRDGQWDCWVGPRREPRTGKRFGAVRWQNHFRAEGLPDPDRRWLKSLADEENMLRQIKRDLKGKRLGTSLASHGLILSRLADGVPVPEILRQLQELAEIEAPTQDLFPGEVA